MREESCNTKITKAILTPNLVEQMHRHLSRRDLRFGLLWRLGIDTGLRVSDLLSLRLRDFKGLKLTVTEKKTGKRKEIKIELATWMEIDNHVWYSGLAPDDYLFYRRMNRRDIPMSRQWARAVIARIASQMGLEAIGSHSMRKIYACEKFRVTGSFEAVKEALNHERLETTLIYLKDMISKDV